MAFDVVRRIMTDYFGYRVFQVMNITDVDDKIITRSAERNVSVEQLSRGMEELFWQDMDSLGV